MKKLILILAAAFALLRAAADPYPNMKYWKPSEKTGYFTDGGNWDGDRVPGAGETAAVKDQGDGYRGHYVVKFPSGLTTVGSLLYFATLYANSSVTLDTTEGGFYHVPAEVPADYKGFGFYTSGEDHFFNFESTRNNEATCSFSGGKIKAYADGDVFRLDVESGNLNWYNPNGVQTTSDLVLSKGNAVVTAKAGSSLDAGRILLRNGVFAVEGGTHAFHADFYVNDAFTGVKTLFSQSSGTIRQDGGFTYVGKCKDSENRFELKGDAQFIQADGREFQVGAASGTKASFEMSGNASATLSRFKMSTGNPSEGEIESRAVISEGARLTLLNEAIIGERTSENVSSLELSGNAALNSKGMFRAGYPTQGNGVVTLDDDAVFLAEGEVNVHDDSLIAVGGRSKLRTENYQLSLKGGGTVALEDNAKFESMAGVNIEQGLMSLTNDAAFFAAGNVYVNADCLVDASDASEIRTENGKLFVRSGGTVALSDSARLETMDGANVEGGVLSFSESASLLMNTNAGHQCKINVVDGGLLELDGGDSFFSCLWSESGNLEKESVIRIKKGTHRSIYQGDGMVPLSIGGTAAKSVFEMSGGNVIVPRMVRVGIGNTGEGYAVFRLSGGLFEIDETANEANFNVADGDSSKGRVELLGGKLRCQYLRGWYGSKLQNPNATGSATLYADGGTIAPNRLTGDSLLKNFDDAVLGAKGLTVDTEHRNITISQAFTDAPDKAGLFTKTGGGALTVLKESGHAQTLVNQGELNFSAPKFGRNVTVVGGASISTVGAPSTIEVESLTLGSDESVGYVKIDSGDTITVTGGSDGLRIVKGVIICDGLSNPVEYPIFNILGNIDVEKLAGELAKIRCTNSNKDNFISFVPQVTENGVTVKLKVEPYSHTGATWLGNGSDWAAAGNWEGGVPGPATIATFPAEAAAKTVAVGADRAFEAKVTGGEYVFEGGGKLTLDRISVSGGSLAVNVPQTPNMGMEIDVAANAAVAFNQPVESGSGLDKIVKTGTGLLTLGASPDWFGSWAFNGGKTVATKPSSLGAHQDVDGTVSVGAATLRLEMEPRTAGEETAVDKTLEIDSGSNRPAIIDVEKSHVKFTMGMNAVSGGLIKKGSKDLTIELPEGTSTITASNLGSGYGISDSAIGFDEETGIPPEAQPGQNAPFGGLTVAEGTLRLTGSGSDKTIVNQKHALLIGGGGSLAHPAALEISGIRMNQGDSGVHCFIGGAVGAGSAATNSVLRVIDGAYFDSDTVNLARKPHDHGDGRAFANHVLAVTNATVSVSWVMMVGNNGDRDLKGSFEIGEAGVAEVRGTCIEVQGGIGGTVSDGGILRAMGSAGNSESFLGLYCQNSVWGDLNFVNGGILDVKAVKSSRNAPLALPLTVRFDGGIFKVRGTDGVSMSSDVEKRTFNAGINGMYIDVEDASSRHTVVMPVNGAGGIVKTGAGDLFIAKCAQVREEITAAENTYTLNCEGVSSVEAGSLTIESGAAREDLKVAVAKGAELRICGSQKLGALSGGGKVTSGGLASDIAGDPNGGTFVVAGADAGAAALTCTIDRKASDRLECDEVPLFENIVLSRVVVDFGAAGEIDLKVGKIPVARIGDGVTADPTRWASINRPPLTSAVFTVENGVVYAELEKSGMILIVR